jgi:RNA polymerase sigma-70 factor (ECF subfamily)
VRTQQCVEANRSQSFFHQGSTIAQPIGHGVVESDDTVTVTQPNREFDGASPPVLRELFEEHASFVWRSLRRLSVAEADLDDMLQEVFLVVHQRLSDYEERSRARSWLYSICVRVASGQRRKVNRRRENLSLAVPERASAPVQLQGVEDREALALGHRLLALLPDEQREVFVLYEVEEMPMAEIAAALGCPLYTAYSRLRTARLRLLTEVTRERQKGAL